MEDVFGNQPQVETQGEPQVQVQPETDVQQPEAGAPPAPHTEGHVPLAALEAERSGRRDWKEKALRYEGELKAVREQIARAGQQPTEQQQFDPAQAFEQRIQNMTLNASEMLARKVHGTEEVDKAFETFQKAVAKDPSLHQRAMQQADPWDFVVREGKRMAFLEEVGDDPSAYRTKLEAEIRASLDSAAAPKPVLPQSLASARSTAPRSAPAFTGPPPLSSLFAN